MDIRVFLRFRRMTTKKSTAARTMPAKTANWTRDAMPPPAAATTPDTGRPPAVSSTGISPCTTE